jgi:hypothetical protein
VVQFLSYEGTMTAKGGAADGMTSTDIGVSETSVTTGYSLQLSGTGSNYGDFTWQNAAQNTFGTMPAAGAAAPARSTPARASCPPPAPASSASATPGSMKATAASPR